MARALAACHVHSDWSYDGSWSIDLLAKAFSRRGCRVVMMTEHDRGFSDARLNEFRVACEHASSDEIYVLPGIEYSDAANHVHILVWGRVPFLGEGLPTEALLEAVANHGGVAVFAHPGRRDAWQTFKSAWADRLVGIEIWNRKYDGWAPGEHGPALLSQAPCIPFVGLDFHTRRQMFPLAMALEVGDVINENAVINCLRERRCAAFAFGGPVNAARFQTGLPLLRLAERGRGTLAAAKRYSKARLAGRSDGC